MAILTQLTDYTVDGNTLSSYQYLMRGSDGVYRALLWLATNVLYMYSSDGVSWTKIIVGTVSDVGTSASQPKLSSDNLYMHFYSQSSNTEYYDRLNFKRISTADGSISTLGYVDIPTNDYYEDYENKWIYPNWTVLAPVLDKDDNPHVFVYYYQQWRGYVDPFEYWYGDDIQYSGWFNHYWYDGSIHEETIYSYGDEDWNQGWTSYYSAVDVNNNFWCVNWSADSKIYIFKYDFDTGAYSLTNTGLGTASGIGFKSPPSGTGVYYSHTPTGAYVVFYWNGDSYQTIYSSADTGEYLQYPYFDINGIFYGTRYVGSAYNVYKIVGGAQVFVLTFPSGYTLRSNVYDPLQAASIALSDGCCTLLAYRVVLTNYNIYFYADSVWPIASVTTLPCLSMGNKSAILGGQYMIIDSAVIGIEYWYDSNWKTRTQASMTGAYTDYVRYFNVSGLARGRTYYFRAYIYYNSTYYYGETLNFTTYGSTIRIPLHTEYNNARYCIRQIEKVSLGRSYVDEDGNFTYESRLARNA